MEDFQPHTGINWKGDVGIVNYGGGDSSMIVMFYVKPVLNKAKSQETGRPYHDDRIFVRIHPPGERLNIVDREANDSDKRRFPAQWHQFQQNQPQMSDGTPIGMLFPAQPSIAAALEASGVHTVEQCANLSAHAIETIGMGCQQWVNEAQRYLQVAERGVKHSEMKKIIDEKDREITSLKNKVDLLMAQVNHFKELQQNAVTMQDVQQLIANQGGSGKRGVFVPGTKLPKSFDAQDAQIAATHPTRDLAKGKGAKSSAPAKRQRARINH